MEPWSVIVIQQPVIQQPPAQRLNNAQHSAQLTRPQEELQLEDGEADGGHDRGSHQSQRDVQCEEAELLGLQPG